MTSILPKLKDILHPVCFIYDEKQYSRYSKLTFIKDLCPARIAQHKKLGEQLLNIRDPDNMFETTIRYHFIFANATEQLYD